MGRCSHLRFGCVKLSIERRASAKQLGLQPTTVFRCWQCKMDSMSTQSLRRERPYEATFLALWSPTCISQKKVHYRHPHVPSKMKGGQADDHPPLAHRFP